MLVVFGKRLRRLRELELSVQRMVAASDRLGNGWDEGGDLQRAFLWGELVRATGDLEEALLLWDPR